MRVIIITSSTTRSGGTRQALYQAKGLAMRGHDVSLCLPADSEFWENPDAIKPYWVRLPEKASALRGAVEALLPKDFATPTIVHAFHNKAVKRLAWWGLGWRKRNIACVAHRGVIFRPGSPLPFWSPAMRGFLANSVACAKALRFHCPPSKIHVLSNAIPADRIMPTRSANLVREELGLQQQKECVFGFVGNGNPLKGAEILFRSFAKLAAPTARLVTVGLMPEQWEPLCKELGIIDKVVMVKHTDQVCDYLQCMDVFVFPSYGMDSAPNTVLEAICMGLPIIGTDIGGVPDMIKGNGLLVPTRDTTALSRAMQVMLDDPVQRNNWSAVSKKLGEQYSVTSRCERLERLYTNFLQA